MFSSPFADVQNAQSMRMQRTEIPTLKMLILSQLGVYLNQRYTCYRDRQLDTMSVQAIMVLLEDLHTLICLRDYKGNLEVNHKEKFKELKVKCRLEIEKYMTAKQGDTEAQKIKTSLVVMDILNEIFSLETKFLERFGLIEPEEVTFVQEDANIEFLSEEFKEAEKEYDVEQLEKLTRLIIAEYNDKSEEKAEKDRIIDIQRMAKNLDLEKIIEEKNQFLKLQEQAKEELEKELKEKQD